MILSVGGSVVILCQYCDEVMRRILYLLLGLPLFLSCSDKYSIKGDTSQSVLNGKMAYLKEYNNDILKAIDSCEVVHGKFNMTGILDSVRCVSFFMDNESVIPVVLEQGTINIDIFNARIRISGTPLNDSLYTFLNKRDSLVLILNDLPHRESLMILEGYSEDQIVDEINGKANALTMQLDRLETDFITRNFDNVLGVTFFLQLCNDAYKHYGYPTTTPQIDEIYGRAPQTFRDNPDVSRYIRLVNEREE